MSTQSEERMSDAGSVSAGAPSPLASTFSSLVPHDRIEIREGYADVGDVRLHYVEAGEGPLVVLLHGFPEFWFGWRLQIAPLAAAGFRVVAPDTRGYNLSSKPEGFEAYAVDLLADDIRGLIARTRRRVRAAGRSRLGREHRLDDRDESPGGGRPTRHPQRGPSTEALGGTQHPSQLRKSWYFFFFATPGLPEDVVHARDWHFFRHFLHDANPPYTPQEIERYVEAWSQPGAAAGMINYYRASVRQSQKEAAAKLRPISAPTLVIWGERDDYLGSDLAEPQREDVPNLDRVERLPTRRTGCTTTRPSASTNCSSTSSPERRCPRQGAVPSAVAIGKGHDRRRGRRRRAYQRGRSQ